MQYLVIDITHVKYNADGSISAGTYTEMSDYYSSVDDAYTKLVEIIDIWMVQAIPDYEYDVAMVNEHGVVRRCPTMHASRY